MAKSTIRTQNGTEAEVVDLAPAPPAPPPAPDEDDGAATRPPEAFGPGIPVAAIWWQKDAAPQLPNVGAGGSRTEAWPQEKMEPVYRILFLPRIRQFWLYYLGVVGKNERGGEPSREYYVPAEHSITWRPWRGDEDIPAGAWRRFQLQLKAAAEASAA